jgi:Sortase and related acyltransferases
MPIDNVIEPATQADFPEIADIWEASVRATHDFLSEADIQYFKPLILNEYLKAVALYCIRDNGGILGFLGLSPEKIEMLFLRPDVRGRGIGKKFMRFAIDEKGIKKVDVNEQNPQAVDFYKRMGFEVVSRSPLDPQGKPFPILSMELKNDSNSSGESS